MSGSKARSLSSLFCSGSRVAGSKPPSSASTDNETLKQAVSSLGTSSNSASPNYSSKFSKGRPRTNKLSSSTESTAHFAAEILKLEAESALDYGRRHLSNQISSILCGGSSLHSNVSFDQDEAKRENSLKGVLEIPWFPSPSISIDSMHRKEISRCRKQKWIYSTTQERSLSKLVTMCATKLGADATIKVFGKLGRETGVKEYNALIRVCIENARETEGEETRLQQIHKAYRLLESMREHGFLLQEETYGPFLMFLIDLEMVQDFEFFRAFIIDNNPESVARLGYYEMLLWIRVDNDDKVRGLFDNMTVFHCNDHFSLKENYLLALCESNRKDDILQLLEIVDISRFSSTENIEKVFNSLGRLLLEPFAEKVILALKSHGTESGKITNMIYHYSICMPNSTVEAVVSKIRNLHAKLEVSPSPELSEKIIQFCIDSSEVHMALDMVEDMCETGLNISLQTFHSILHACEDSCNYNLVHRIYSEILRNKLKPNNETFRIMVSLCTRMKDFESAYGYIQDLKEMNLVPTANMYNAIMAGYFREKNMQSALWVLKHMKDADVNPDSQTFSYLIANCDCEEDIVKYHEELERSGVQVTKHVLMSLIYAYAACGQFDKAKQVVLSKDIPVKSLNELKSVLVSSLASRGRISDAIALFEEVKEANCILEPKTIVCLIEHLQEREGYLKMMLQLLEDLNDPIYWTEGCWRVILRCVQCKELSMVVDLLKQFKEKIHDEIALQVLFDESFCVIAEAEAVDVQFGIDLLKAIKEKVGIEPSRKGLDFLLTACARAKDLNACHLIWKEYPKAGLPYNILSFLRMYQALLASGDQKAAEEILKGVRKDDPHVRQVIIACQKTFSNNTTTTISKEEEEKNKEEAACCEEGGGGINPKFTKKKEAASLRGNVMDTKKKKKKKKMKKKKEKVV
ncbi:pentatricopeptide repeat-containing protein At4g04790, mitochondrial-like [Impatiens glandulifera]|uniref:pentatricopeptide repeat-containing protein At4g04790, mitochondrial-like n=1 Tax=Impatiens glandulifera TaxID=253017 RepID=UPI001FB0B85A|nr:pentatricopeptide repeat-containing protein At4g04790, mitochondrial-like [Impatiens glandulifera]